MPHVENAGSHVPPLQKLARLQEEPSFVVGNRGIRQALKRQRAGFDLMQEIKRAGFPIFPSFLGVQVEVEAVEFFPDVDGQLVPNHAGVLTGLRNG